jgi:penicillin-insensitive murein endopeptidase
VLGFLLGRTFVHSAVRNAMRDAYADLSKSTRRCASFTPKAGGPGEADLRPTRPTPTASVDFHLPVRTLDGQVSQLPASPLNKFGYSLEFDNSGRSGSYKLDFEAMALHLLALDRAARANATA